MACLGSPNKHGCDVSVRGRGIAQTNMELLPWLWKWCVSSWGLQTGQSSVPASFPPPSDVLFTVNVLYLFLLGGISVGKRRESVKIHRICNRKAAGGWFIFKRLLDALVSPITDFEFVVGFFCFWDNRPQINKKSKSKNVKISSKICLKFSQDVWISCLPTFKT